MDGDGIADTGMTGDPDDGGAEHEHLQVSLCYVLAHGTGRFLIIADRPHHPPPGRIKGPLAEPQQDEKDEDNEEDEDDEDDEKGRTRTTRTRMKTKKMKRMKRATGQG